MGRNPLLHRAQNIVRAHVCIVPSRQVVEDTSIVGAAEQLRNVRPAMVALTLAMAGGFEHAASKAGDWRLGYGGALELKLLL